MSGRGNLPCATLALAVGASLACAPVYRERMPAAPERRGEPIATVPVVLTPAIDYRPSALKDFHDPVRSQLVSLFYVTGLYFAYAYDGPLLYGDDQTRLIARSDHGNGSKLSPMEALSSHLRAVLNNALGADVGIASTSPVGAMQDPTRALPGGRGFVMVPVVDQLDVCTLSSETRKHEHTMKVERRWNWDTPEGRGWIRDGGGSYRRPGPGEEARASFGSFDAGPVHGVAPGSRLAPYTHLETTTTMRSEGGIEGSAAIGNVRLRLAVFRVEGGHVAARATVYAAGAGHGLAEAMASAGRRMAKGVADFILSQRQ